MNKQSLQKKKLKPLEVGPYVKRAISVAAGYSGRGEHDEAIELSRQLHEQFPKRADVNDALSLALVDAKRTVEALPFAKAAWQAEPKDPAYIVNLARLYLDIGEAEEALPLLKTAVGLKNAPPEAPWALAKFFFDIGDVEQSIPYFEACLAKIEPDRRVEVKLEYFDALRAGGHIDAAEALIDSLIEHAPENCLFLSNKTSLRTTRIDNPAAQQLVTLLPDAKLPDPARSAVLLQIGRMYENSEQYEQAFRYFGEAKQYRQMRHDLASFMGEVDDLIGTFSAEVFEKFKHLGSASEQPVFVVGMPRSGTTMTEQIIGAHPDAAGVGELTRIRMFAKRLCPPGNAGRFIDLLSNVSAQALAVVPEKYLQLINFLAPGKKRLVDKMPHNFLAVGFISALFPRAKFVHVHRNPLDNFVSAFQNPMNDFHSYSFDQEEYGKYYLGYQRLMSHWCSVLPDRIFDWPYDEVVADPQSHVARLLEFLGLPWSDECLRFHEKKTTVRTFSMHQVRNPVSVKSVERWRNYETQLGPIRQVLGL